MKRNNNLKDLLYQPVERQVSSLRQLEEAYEQADVHESVTAGTSFPADPRELELWLNAAFSKASPLNGIGQTNIRALFAPHIDPRVGLSSYVKAFNPLTAIRPRRVVILATSHYAGLYPRVYSNHPFITTLKDFRMPGRLIPTDRRSVKRLLQRSGETGLSGNDRAHRMEHSIELHLLFLSHIWKHDFSIVPILVGDFQDLYYHTDTYLSRQIEAFGAQLREEFGQDEQTLFLVSGDLAHIGKKFGDTMPARRLLSKVRIFDQAFLSGALEGNAEYVLRLMKQEYDPYRICGFPPLYTLLKTFPGLQGHRLAYDFWDESERESGVSFGAIQFN